MSRAMMELERTAVFVDQVTELTGGLDGVAVGDAAAVARLRGLLISG